MLALKAEVEATKAAVEEVRKRAEEIGAARLAEAAKREQRLLRDLELAQKDINGMMTEQSTLASLCRDAIASRTQAAQKVCRSTRIIQN